MIAAQEIKDAFIDCFDKPKENPDHPDWLEQVYDYALESDIESIPEQMSQLLENDQPVGNLLEMRVRSLEPETLDDIVRQVASKDKKRVIPIDSLLARTKDRQELGWAHGVKIYHPILIPRSEIYKAMPDYTKDEMDRYSEILHPSRLTEQGLSDNAGSSLRDRTPITRYSTLSEGSHFERIVSS